MSQSTRKNIFKGLSEFALFTFVLTAFFGPAYLAFAQSSTTLTLTLLATPTSITITPADNRLEIGYAQQYTATANFSNSPSLDITNNPLTTWAVANRNVATVDATGVVSSVDLGSGTVTATYGGVVGTTKIDIVPPDPNAPADTGGQYIITDPPSEEVVATVDPNKTPETDPQATEEQTIDQNQINEETNTQNGDSANNPGSTHNEENVQTQEILPAGQNNPDQSNQDNTPPSNNQSGHLPAAPNDELPPAVTVFVPDSTPVSRAETLSSTGTTDNAVSPDHPSSPDDAGSSQSAESREVLTHLETLLYPNNVLPKDGVGRADFVKQVLQKFDLRRVKGQLLNQAYDNPKDALSIFVNYSQFQSLQDHYSQLFGQAIKIRRVSFLGNVVHAAANKALTPYQSFIDKMGQLYPDVSTDEAYTKDIVDGTILGIFNGYYEEPNSPFKPKQILSKIQAVKILMNAADLMKWQYRPELEAMLGGPEALQNQTTPFKDIDLKKDSYMWWYPRYVNMACTIKLFDCKLGTDFHADSYIKSSELNLWMSRTMTYLAKNNVQKNLLADSDADGLLNYYEQQVSFTDPNNKDTDSDGLSDGEEVNLYKSNPFLKDSDGDSLLDGDEIRKYHTSPLMVDTDSDGFSDSAEVFANSNPVDVTSQPVDSKDVGVSDAWALRYNIEVANGAQDTDNDGLSDKLEYQLGTDPTQIDTDSDGLSDAQEVLDLHTDPLNAGDTLDTLGIRITNFQESQLIADPQPLIKGIAPAGVTVEIILRNDFGHEKILGQTVAGENGVFIFQAPQAIRNGRYIFIARALLPEQKMVQESSPIHVRIDSTLKVTQPNPKKLSDKVITSEVTLKNVKLEIIDKKPVLSGVTDYGSKVIATWKSVVATSALIADATTGNFAIMPPKDLEFGDHQVYVQSVRQKDGALSKPVKVFFRISAALPTFNNLKPAAATETQNGLITPKSLLLGFSNFVSGNGPVGWIVLGVVVIIVLGAVVYFILRAKKRFESDDDDESSNSKSNPPSIPPPPVVPPGDNSTDITNSSNS